MQGQAFGDPASPAYLAQLTLAIQELSATTRVGDVVDILRRSARTLCAARGVTVVAREGELCHYLADDSASALWPDQRFPMEACISGWAMLNGAPAVVPDIYRDARIPQEIYRPTYVRSLIMTPVGEGRPYAAFGAYWDDAREHGVRDVEVLGALAACAAGALERIWLGQELRSQAGAAARSRAPGPGESPPANLLDALLRSDAEAALRERDAQLAEALRRLNAILDNATVSVFLMDERQQCAYMNAAAEKLTGYSLAETLGRPLHDVIHHTRPDGRPYPLAECPIDRAFPKRAQTQGEEVFVHRDGSFYPVAFTASPILDDASRTIGTIIEVQDITARKAAEAQQNLLMREIDHRSRNVLSVVQSLVRMTRSDDPEAFKRLVSSRIEALARAQASLAASSWQGASLQELVRDAVAATASPDRVTLEGQDLLLAADQVQPLSMIIHELATNAVKYGALSAGAGAVRVSWSASDGRLRDLTWRETGGPSVEPRRQEGFGSRLLKALARQLQAALETEWRREGLVVRLAFRLPPPAE